MKNRPQIQTVYTGVDKAKVFLATLLLISSFVIYFILDGDRNVAGWMRWGALFGVLLCAAGMFFWSTWGKEFWAYCQDAVREAKKVVWPTRKEAIQMTLYVFAFVVVMSLFLWLVDMTLSWAIVDKILGWGAAN